MSDEHLSGHPITQYVPEELLAPKGNRVAISDHLGLVCLTFEKVVSGLELQPAEAMVLGEQLMRQCYRTVYGDYPTTQGKSMLTDQMRIRCVNRVLMQLRQEPPRTEVEMRARAAAIVDEVLKAVA